MPRRETVEFSNNYSLPPREGPIRELWAKISVVQNDFCMVQLYLQTMGNSVDARCKCAEASHGTFIFWKPCLGTVLPLEASGDF